MAGPQRVRSVLETCIYVDDLDVAQRFYEGVLGLTLFSREPDRHVFFRCGDAMFLIFAPDRTLRPDTGVPAHGARGPGHVCFAVSDDEIDAWRERFGTEDIEVEQEIRWPRGGRSLYVRDPAGNSVEIASPRIWGLND